MLRLWNAMDRYTAKTPCRIGTAIPTSFTMLCAALIEFAMFANRVVASFNASASVSSLLRAGSCSYGTRGAACQGIIGGRGDCRACFGARYVGTKSVRVIPTPSVASGKLEFRPRRSRLPFGKMDQREGRRIRSSWCSRTRWRRTPLDRNRLGPHCSRRAGDP